MWLLILSRIKTGNKGWTDHLLHTMYLHIDHPLQVKVSVILIKKQSFESIIADFAIVLILPPSLIFVLPPFSPPEHLELFPFEQPEAKTLRWSYHNIMWDNHISIICSNITTTHIQHFSKVLTFSLILWITSFAHFCTWSFILQIFALHCFFESCCSRSFFLILLRFCYCSTGLPFLQIVVQDHFFTNC